MGTSDTANEVPQLLTFAEVDTTSPAYQRWLRRFPWAAKIAGTRVGLLGDDGRVRHWYGHRPAWWKRCYYRLRMWLA